MKYIWTYLKVMMTPHLFGNKYMIDNTILYVASAFFSTALIITSFAITRHIKNTHTNSDNLLVLFINGKVSLKSSFFGAGFIISLIPLLFILGVIYCHLNQITIYFVITLYNFINLFILQGIWNSASTYNKKNSSENLGAITKIITLLSFIYVLYDFYTLNTFNSILLLTKELH